LVSIRLYGSGSGSGSEFYNQTGKPDDLVKKK
jgi:hypothetical protein